MSLSFLTLKTKSISSSALLLGGFFFLSRILGVVRDNLLANSFPKSLTDVYFASFRIPDFLYAVLISGGITAAFLPVFSEKFHQSRQESQELFSNVLLTFLMFLVLGAIVFFFIIPFLVNIIVPGFSPSQKSLTVLLTRIMLFSPLLLGMSAIFSGVAQHLRLFLAYALAPVMYNLGIIFGILILGRRFSIKGVAFGVVIGAFLHLLVQFMALRKENFLPRFYFNFKDAFLRKIFYLMGPRIVGSATFQINFIVITAVASFISQGAVSVFNFANNIYHLPIGLIGISFAQASFPVMSQYFVQGRKSEFKNSFKKILNQILILTFPLGVAMFIFKEEIVKLVLGTSLTGKALFTGRLADLTAASLGIFSLSLFAASSIFFLSRVFFSQHDTRTPVKIAIMAMALNVILAFLLPNLLSEKNTFSLMVAKISGVSYGSDLAIVGLPLAVAVSSIMQFALLYFVLWFRLLKQETL